MDENSYKDKNQRQENVHKKISWGNINPGKMAPWKIASRKIATLSPKKKKRKIRKLTPEKIISQVKGKRKRRDDKKID